MKSKLHCGDYVFLYFFFLNNIAFFQYRTWIVHWSSQTSSQRPKPKHQLSALLQKRCCATQLVRHTLTNTYIHTLSHTVQFKAFMHTLSSPKHIHKVFRSSCCRFTEFVPDPRCPPLLFQHIFLLCHGNWETGWETISTTLYMNEDIPDCKTSKSCD